MVVNVNYSKVIEEMGVQLKDLIVQNAIQKAQLEAVTQELNKIIEQQNIAEQQEIAQQPNYEEVPTYEGEVVDSRGE